MINYYYFHVFVLKANETITWFPAIVLLRLCSKLKGVLVCPLCGSVQHKSPTKPPATQANGTSLMRLRGCPLFKSKALKINGSIHMKPVKSWITVRVELCNNWITLFWGQGPVTMKTNLLISLCDFSECIPRFVQSKTFHSKRKFQPRESLHTTLSKNYSKITFFIFSESFSFRTYSIRTLKRYSCLCLVLHFVCFFGFSVDVSTIYITGHSSEKKNEGHLVWPASNGI